MKKILIPILIIFLMAIATSIILLNFQITGKTISTPSYFTHTKAICNSTNFCQDYKVECEGNKTVRIMPISGAAIQQPENWQDPRDKEAREKLC